MKKLGDVIREDTRQCGVNEELMMIRDMWRIKIKVADPTWME